MCCRWRRLRQTLPSDVTLQWDTGMGPAWKGGAGQGQSDCTGDDQAFQEEGRAGLHLPGLHGAGGAIAGGEAGGPSRVPG